MKHHASQKRGPAHKRRARNRPGTREHRAHPPTRPLPSPPIRAIEAGSREPFELEMSASGQIVAVRALSAGARHLLPAMGQVAWAAKQHWWIEPPGRRN